MSVDPAVSSVKGARAEDQFGTPLGTVDAVFLDDATGQLSWVVVGGDAVAPATGAQLEGSSLRLPVDAAAVQTAPRLGGRGHLDADHLAALQDHYRGVGSTGRHAADTGGYGFAGNQAADAGARSLDGDGAMTLSEERLSVGTEVAPYSRAVLRIETVTEEVMVPVTVTRQVARVEYLPPHHESTGQATAPAGRVGEQATGWVTLHGEEPVVQTRRVPVERVRLATSWTQEQQQVSGQVRREELALDDDTARR
ncbi:YsnF/AvaK domain-containing protein [Goekera deserti]|nr:YsnF/AvaK domain-containing protein [Goekera deserti]